MPLTRRALLASAALGLSGALAASGCVASPVVTGDPGLAPSSPPPTQAPADAAAQAALASLRSLTAQLTTSEVWPEQPWAQAATAQCDAQLALVSLPDPLSADEQQPFASPPDTAAPPTSTEEAVASLASLIDGAGVALEAAAAAAAEADLRLLYASAATAVAGLTNRASLPESGEAAPRRLADQSAPAAIAVALGHAWALIYGLGVGLGRLPADDALSALGAARLPAVKTLRNELRDALGDQVPEQPAAFELPTPMSTPDEIRAGWSTLEANLLAGYAGVVAADADAIWRAAMREQVAPLQAVGGALGFWPGWVV